VIEVFGSSETLRRVFILQNKAFLNQSSEVLLEGVVAEADLALDCREATGLTVFESGQYPLVKVVHFKP